MAPVSCQACRPGRARPTSLLTASVTAAVALALALPARPALGQIPVPRLQSVFPPGAAAGQTVDVAVRGPDLEGSSTLWFSHPGLRAFHRKGQQFTVAVAPGTPPGLYDVRVASHLGVSNPRVFVVSDRPEAREAEPNNTPAQANAVAVGTVITGEIGATDLDCFRFEGRKDERVFIEVWAERIESRLDGQLHVYGPDGAQLAETLGGYGPDPMLDLTLPAAGTYTVKLHDVTYAGSAEHGYRLLVHQGPHIDAILPLSAQPGVPTTFTLFGRNLGAPPCPELVQVDDHPLERREVTFTLPAAAEAESEATGPVPELTLSLAATRRGAFYHLQTPSGRSNPVFIAEARDAVVLEREPNNGGDAVQMVEPPCEISGAFGRPGDLDVYRFRARKGEVWWLEALAERTGSPADPVFMVQRVVEKNPPQDLAAGDDLPDRGAGPAFPTASVDAAVRWQAPEDGLYQVACSDLYSSQRGDARLAYRLLIRREQPDFRVFLVPQNIQMMDGLTLRTGGRLHALALAERLDGFHRPIRIEPRELPPGVSCLPTVIAAGQAVAPVVLEAADTSPLHLGPIRLQARGLAGDRKELLDYTRGAGVAPEIVHEVQGAGMVWPPAAPQGIPTPGPARLTQGLVVGVREGAPFRLTVTPEHWDVAPGATLELTGSVTRHAGFTEAVQLSTINLPPNVPAAGATIARDKTSESLKLSLPDNVPPGTYTVLLTGTGAFPFNKDPNAKQKGNVNATEPSNPITVTVRK